MPWRGYSGFNLHVLFLNAHHLGQPMICLLIVCTLSPECACVFTVTWGLVDLDFDMEIVIVGCNHQSVKTALQSIINSIYQSLAEFPLIPVTLK